MEKRVTLKDVASAAGVTTATVSYVVNDTPGQKITPETRERVLRAVQELHYVPNSVARALRRNRTNCVGIVAKKNLAVPRFSQIIRGIQSEFEDLGIMMVICTNKVKQNGLSDYLVAYYEGRVDGIIFLCKDNRGPSKESVEHIENEHIPFVVFDGQQDTTLYSSIDFDYRGGAYLLMNHVLKLNPKRVLYVKPQIDTAQERLREQGMRESLQTNPCAELRVVEVPITLDNLETWDLRYSVGITPECARLTNAFVTRVEEGITWLERGDALVTSWSGWTDPVRHQLREAGIITVELANNGESYFLPDYSMRQPNFDAGVACANEILSLIAGKAPSSRLLHLTSIVNNA